MHSERDTAGSTAWTSPALAAMALLCAGTLAGCANPGPPRPPSLQLPALVDDLSAERIGDRVLLRWATPSRTTDDLDLRGTLSAEICRSDVQSAAGARRPYATCAVVKRVPTAPGLASTWDDLPRPLLADPVTPLIYRITIFNEAGRAAGKSRMAAYAAAGAAPPPVESLTAAASEAGVILKWKTRSEDGFAVDLARTDLSSLVTPSSHKAAKTASLPAHLDKPRAAGRPASAGSSETYLRAAPSDSGKTAAGTVDTSAAVGGTYSYTAQNVRFTSVEGHTIQLRSAASQPVTLTLRDTFPPNSPTGLATIPGAFETQRGERTSYIDLSWAPNTELDLAGYLVYRQLARPNGGPQGPLGKLTPLPIATPAYRDVAVAPGQRYIYSVTAVDASGNESAPSAKAQEVAEAPNAGMPQ